MNVREVLDGEKKPKPAEVTDRRARLVSSLGLLGRHPYFSAGIVAIVVALGAYWSMDGAKETTKADIGTVAKGKIENLVTAIGSLQPLNFVDVGAQVSGQLKILHVAVGDEVKKGDLLAEIDSAVAAAKVDADNAQLLNYRAQLTARLSDQTLATAQADRQTRLKNDNATSQDAFDSAQAAMRSANAQVKSLQAQIQQSESSLKADQATLGYSKIYAPMSGTVSSITAKEGQTLNANQSAPTILQIADLTVMSVSTQVSEADVSKLRVGMGAYFTTLGDPDRRWAGKLRQILPIPTVTNNVVLYTALFDVANPNKILMPQMTAQVFFVVSAAYDVVVVPVSALHYGPARGTQSRNTSPAGAKDGASSAPVQRDHTAAGGQGRRAHTGGTTRAHDGATAQPRNATVTIVKDDGSQETRAVTVGVTDRVNAQILSGLQEGEKIVAGTEVATGNARVNNNNNRGGFRGPGIGGPGFGGP